MDRPYRLLQHECSIPQEWPGPQKKLWEERLKVIAENDHIKQIEQPAYKRRWDEPFGDKEFLDAYEWWLSEKAEWLLEHKCGGGPIELEIWAAQLLEDPRVGAAYQVALDLGSKFGNPTYQRERTQGDFPRHFKRIIENETVPDQRQDFKKKHEKLRGIDARKHLPNGVPRERFRSLSDRPGFYMWAGKDIWNGVEGDVWDA